MAAWQYVLYLIPAEWCRVPGNGPELLVDGSGGVDLEAAWREHQPNARFVSLISKVLPASTSWHADLKIWGDDERTDIQVWYEGVQVESVMARIDTRTDTTGISANVVELALALDCWFYFPADRLILPPDVSILGKAIAGSAAAQFSADPRDFLRRLR